MNRSLHICCCFYSPSLGTNYTITVFGGGNGQLQRVSSPGTQQAECKFQFAGECGRSWKRFLQQALASLFCRLPLGSTHQRRNETSQGACKVVHARGSDPTSVAFFSLAAAVSISLRAWANLIARPAAAAAAAGQNATSNVAHYNTIFKSVGAFIASIFAFSISTSFHISINYPWCIFCMLAFISRL